MNSLLLSISIFLISLTNLVVIPVNGSAPITVFTLFIPIIFIAIFAKIYRLLPYIENPLIYLIAVYILAVAILSADHTRWSSVAYSMFYFIFYLFINNADITKKHLINSSKLIIISYLINVLFAKIVFTITGDLSPIKWLLQATPDDKTGAMRYHGFSSEPSYAAFVVIVALIAYINLNTDNKNVKLFFIASATFMIISFSSIYGFILLGAFAINRLLKRIDIKPSRVLILGIISILLFVLARSFFASGSETRGARLAMFFLSGSWELDDFRSVDTSAFMRVGPFISYVNDTRFLSLQTYLGHGPGAAAVHFGDVFNDVIGIENRGFESGTLNLGFIPAFLYDYGFIGVGLMFLLVFRRAMKKILSIECAVFLLLIVNANFNTQIFWYVWGMFFLMNRCINPTDSVDHAETNNVTWLSA
jgi:hypothetical protein